MLERTRALWDKHNQAVGDRLPLFGAVGETVNANRVLYPGSYVDLTPAFIWPETTFVDVDRRFDPAECALQLGDLEHGDDGSGHGRDGVSLRGRHVAGDDVVERCLQSVEDRDEPGRDQLL